MLARIFHSALLSLSMVSLFTCHQQSAPVNTITATTPREVVEMSISWNGDDPMLNERNNDMRKQLENEATVVYREVTNAEFFADLSQRLATPINVNWTALQNNAGIEKSSKISLEAKQIPIKTILNMALKKISAEAGDLDPIGYGVVDGVLTVSTKSDLSVEVTSRLYDIRSLLVRPANHQPPLLEHASGQLRVNGVPTVNISLGGSTGSGQGLFGDTGEEEVEVTREEMIQQITELITENVGDFDEWVQSGGDISSLRELNSRLIVKTTPENHLKVAHLLRAMKRDHLRTVSVHFDCFIAPGEIVNDTVASVNNKLILNGSEANTLLRSLRSNAKRIASGRTIAANGQRVYVSAVGDSSPLTQGVHHGLVVGVRPTIAIGNRSLTIAMASDLALGRSADDALDHDIVSHRTTAEIPNGGAIVLTGASAAMNSIDNGESDVVIVLRTMINAVD